MSDLLLLPDQFARVTAVDVVVPVTGKPDLTDPITGRIVIPARVDLHLRRDEGTSQGEREWAFATVVGPRRLKSQQPGQRISSGGWQHARGDDFHKGAVRPGWLTDVLADMLPPGWSPALLDLPERTGPEEQARRIVQSAIGSAMGGPALPLPAYSVRLLTDRVTTAIAPLLPAPEGHRT